MEVPNVLPFFDDIILVCEDEESLGERLQQVFHIFQNSGLKLKREKCQFAVHNVDFLGFRIDKFGT